MAEKDKKKDALDEKEIRKVAQKVVDISKATARVDTGALKRSISYTYVKKVVIFRQIYYGQFKNNSQLEKNAAKLIPRGVEWKIIYTSFGGETIEIGRTRSGRASQRSIISTLLSGSTTAIKKLIAKNKAKRAAKAKD
jgi:hypothetical protein